MNRHGMPFSPGSSLVKRGGVIREAAEFASSRKIGREGRPMKLSRPILHKARIADAILFWPVLALVIWGEIFAPPGPGLLDRINDKILHFMAYFLLAAMASMALKSRRTAMLAVLGIIVLGGVLEIIQGYVGRDMSFYDELANTLGAIPGGIIGRLIIEPLRRQFAGIHATD
jgi:VanZ family protein